MSEAITLPDWLTIEQLEQILKNKSKSFQKIVKVEDSHGSKKGDHYLSEIIRFKVVYRDNDKVKELCVIHKDPSKGCTSFLDDVNGVQKELGVYKDVVPYTIKVLDPAVVAECHLSSDSGCLVLEDLVAAGYRSVDRSDMLDFDHCRQALMSLGAFHAATARLAEISPSTFSVIGKETAYTHKRDTIPYAYCEIANPAMISILAEDPEGKEFVGALQAFSKNYWDRLLEAVRYRDCIQVLNQGDFWTSNIMFKYSDSVPVHAKLLDFQIVRFTSPAFDLHLFMATSMRPDVLKSSLDHLLDAYLDSLNSNLKRIGSTQSLTKEKLTKVLSDTYVIGLTYTLFLVPIVLCDPKDPLHISETTKADYFQGFPNGNPYAKAYSQKHIVKQIISMLKHYRKCGYI